MAKIDEPRDYETLFNISEWTRKEQERQAAEVLAVIMLKYAHRESVDINLQDIMQLKLGGFSIVRSNPVDSNSMRIELKRV